jgi:6,7-dimethyl-8-ribityllumazine synthase
MIKSIHRLLLPANAEDYQALVGFLEALGLERGETWERPRNRGIKLQAPESGIEIGLGEGFPDADLIVEVDNADIIYEQVSRLGCVVLREIADCDWGARLFTIELPTVRTRLAVFSYREDWRHPVKPASLNAVGLRFACVVSRFNSFITERLLAGSVEALRMSGARSEDIEIVRVPGSFEIPIAARTLAETGRFDALVCLGCLLRGDTFHYDVIANEATRGVGQAMQETGVPMGFGVLTCDTLEQAIDRAGLKAGNKGFEAALAAIEMANLRKLAGGKAR